MRVVQLLWHRYLININHAQKRLLVLYRFVSCPGGPAVCDMSGGQRSASMFGDAADSNGSDALVAVTSVDELRADAYNARRQRDLLAAKVALLAYKLQMNSRQRHRQQQQLCGRLGVFCIAYSSLDGMQHQCTSISSKVVC